jgi:hypothetical protein
MTDYLLAECIITNLVQAGVILPPKPWRRTATGTQFYYADFSKAKAGSILSFRISVIDGNHVISTTAFINQAKFFDISPTEILERCKV